MKLRGPAHPDAFRVKVGYYRHYFDNLPGCDIAPATDATWPAVSSIKNAAGKDWSYVTMKRIATDLAAHPGKHDGKPEKEIYNDLVALNKTELDRAMDRGTDVHSLLEAKAFGGDIMLTPDAEKYRAVVDQFLADCQPDFFLSEVVVINRTLGYGGTGDAWCIINHPELGRILVDWKTRTDSTKHAAYDEECWQVGGAYFHGEYMIVEEDGQARRAPMPELDGAAIVSLAPDSYKVIPINVENSWASFRALYGFWQSKQGKPFAGKPIHVPRVSTAPLTLNQRVRLDSLRTRIAAFTIDQRAALKAVWPAKVNLKSDDVTAAELDTIEPLIDAITQPPTPDEGYELTAVEIGTLRTKFQECENPAQVNQWITESVEAGRSFNINGPGCTPTQRRKEIIQAAIGWACHGDDTTRAALNHVGYIIPPDSTVGEILGSLTLEEADTLRVLADTLDAGAIRLMFADNGTPYFLPVVSPTQPDRAA